MLIVSTLAYLICVLPLHLLLLQHTEYRLLWRCAGAHFDRLRIGHICSNRSGGKAACCRYNLMQQTEFSID